jgi:abelson tyrosine-protein kinase 1
MRKGGTDGGQLQRVAVAARAVLGTVGDVAHEVLLLSVELVDLAPLPGLAPAAKTLLNIWDAMQDVNVRRPPCTRLADGLTGAHADKSDGVLAPN